MLAAKLGAGQGGPAGFIDPAEAFLLPKPYQCVLVSKVQMVRDARERGLVAWPFVVLTLAAGSFGVLFYLVARELRAGVSRAATT